MPPDAPPRRRGLLLLIAAVVVVFVGSITAFAIASGGGDSSSPSAGGKTPPGCAPVVGAGPAVVGSSAPTFRLPGLHGGCIDLTSLRGHPVIVNFWASWCSGCRVEMPLLKQTYARYHSKGLEIVGIATQDIDSDSRAFIAKYHAPWRFVSDNDENAAHAYHVRPIPQSFFVRADGTIAAHVLGLNRSDLRESLAKILPAT